MKKYIADLKLAIIGSGNVATHLGRAFRVARHDIVGVWSKTRHHAQELAEILDCPVPESLDTMPYADAYIISVSDDAIESIAGNLVNLPENSVVLHTAGSVPMGILQVTGCRHGVLYPLQTFSKNKVVDIGSVPVFVEGSDELALGIITTLAEDISRRVRVLDSERRARLHLAAVFACNFSNHCFALADRELERCGEDFSVLLPLVDEMVEKVHCMKPDKAQTGPAARKDMRILERQEMLIDDEATLEIYKAMSRSIIEKMT